VTRGYSVSLTQTSARFYRITANLGEFTNLGTFSIDLGHIEVTPKGLQVIFADHLADVLTGFAYDDADSVTDLFARLLRWLDRGGGLEALAPGNRGVDSRG
jgi:hypothetical protein